jgi:hypothetical protein
MTVHYSGHGHERVVDHVVVHGGGGEHHGGH